MGGFLTDEQVLVLRKAHKTIRDKRLADRIKAVLYANYGLSYSEISKLLLLDEVSLRRYVKLFKEAGVSGLLILHYSGGQTKLTKTQELELKNHLVESEHIYLAAKEVAGFVKSTYQVNYSVIGMTKLLHRLGFVYKQTVIIPAKVDPIKQEHFLQGYLGLKENLKQDEKILFLDGVHPTHNTQTVKCWIKKGENKQIKTNSGRDRLNIQGALSMSDGKNQSGELELTSGLFKTLDAQTTLEFFDQIQDVDAGRPEVDDHGLGLPVRFPLDRLRAPFHIHGITHAL